MSEYGVVTEPGSIRFERRLPGPIERVWAYLTESEKRRTWLASGPMELRTGGRAELTWRNSELTKEPTPEKYLQYEGQAMESVILECDPPRLLTFSWTEGDGRDSEVCFELTPSDGEILLVLTHRRLPSRGLMVGVAGGWHSHLGVLEDLLRGNKPRPFWSSIAGLEAEYDRRVPQA